MLKHFFSCNCYVNKLSNNNGLCKVIPVSVVVFSSCIMVQIVEKTINLCQSITDKI